MKFSEVLRLLRDREKLTQTEMAEKLGISRSAVGMYEQGKREPDFEIEEKIADYFNVTLDYLRTGAGNLRIESNESFSPTERTILTNYRLADPGTQAAVRKLLDVRDGQEAPEPASEPTHLLPIAAHADDGATLEEQMEDAKMLMRDKK